MKEKVQYIKERFSKLTWARTGTAIGLFLLISLFLYGVCTLALMSFGKPADKLDALQKSLAEELIRFHVIGRSDSDEDQRVKLLVKEAVTGYLQPKLANAQDADEARSILLKEIGSINKVANYVLAEEGFTYQAETSLGESSFPIKQYGDIVLPPGEYEALRVQLGEAEGKNWWCIMFPQLCFVDYTYSVVPDESKAQLRHLLSEEEYAAILQEEDVEVEVEFKLFSWIKSLFE